MIVVLEDLYEDYLKELEMYADEPFTISAKDAVRGYMRGQNSKVLMLFDEGRLSGFLIIGIPPNCHPDCDYFIAQAYVVPESRNKGIMSKALKDFVKEHEGRYCLDVLYRNHQARSFWFARFKELGYVDIFLPYMEHGVTGLCDTLYFEPSRRKGCET